MKRAIIVLALLPAGCSLPPGGVQLLFPNSSDKMMATSAAFYSALPASATADPCNQFSGATFDLAGLNIESGPQTVSLANGVATMPIKGFPIGRQTVIVEVFNHSTPFLEGCRTGTVGSNDSFTIMLAALGTTQVDMAQLDATVDMATPTDMTQTTVLTVVVNELRTPARKLSDVSVTITDSAGTTTTAVMTDATGTAKITTTGLKPPLSITAVPPASNGYTGAATVSGVKPTYSSMGTAAMTIPVELDPSATTGTMTINAPATNGPFTVYWIGSGELFSDFQAGGHSMASIAVNTMPMITGLHTSDSYRVAIIDSTAPIGLATPAFFYTPPSYTPGTFTQMNGTAMTLTTTANTTAVAGTFSTQTYDTALVLPALPSSVAVPLMTAAAIPASNVSVAAPAGSTTTIQLSAEFATEEIATGTNVRSELRQEFTMPASMVVTMAAVSDPPATPTLNPPSPVSSSASFTITATPPANGFANVAGAAVHVHISSGMFHYHAVAPAANPMTTIEVPANLLPTAGSPYTLELSYVIPFSLADGTVAATLADDYSKIIRPVPQELAQRTITFMVQ
jgi:hypothetical protein